MKGWPKDDNRRFKVTLSKEGLYRRFLAIRGEPRRIALGFALGIFVGMSPTMGIQTPIAVVIAAILEWNKISAAVGVWITNPLTAPFIYSLNYMVGARVLGVKGALNLTSEFGVNKVLNMLQNAPHILEALLVGGIVMGLPLAVVSFYFCHWLILRHRQRFWRTKSPGRTLPKKQEARIRE